MDGLETLREGYSEVSQEKQERLVYETSRSTHTNEVYSRSYSSRRCTSMSIYGK